MSQSARLVHDVFESEARLRTAGLLGGVVLAGTIASLSLSHGFGTRTLYADAPSTPEIVAERPKKRRGSTKEDNRDAISSQHVQVKKSWENPGVYAWGSNTGRVAAPDLDDTSIKNPRRIEFFDGQLLRDLKLDRMFAAAIAENGDLYQWGIAYSAEAREPQRTLKGKDLVSVTLSNDRILALSKTGTVYSLPVSKEDQLAGPKASESSWLPFWPSASPISYRTVDTKLQWNEKITAIASGSEHALFLTSAGRVFSSAASSSAFPSRGQLGVPGLTWTSRPTGAFDQPHELTTLRGFNVQAVAAGGLHSLVLDSEGRVFAFGDNTVGQLGQDPNPEIPFVDAPSLLPLGRLYAGTGQVPTVTSIAAGGLNSFFTIEATRVAQPGEDAASSPTLGRISADTWACGQGILGQLGTGRWTHVQGLPAKIKALSGLFEYDEKAKKVIPIRLSSLSVGATHAAAVMANVTHVGAHAGSSENDTNWGADVLWWGGNEYYQLGTGKRNNCAQPVYIGPLDGGEAGEKREAHRFHLTPRKTVKLGLEGEGRRVSVEQRVECGRFVSAVYSGT
ncbi:MAG: hypothetical protein LQ340_006826 [Diploschistes diacapsis]|nr:MAG: hypothetical protein LQ340_006826 [Diploschistes diacapsis]